MRKILEAPLAPNAPRQKISIPATPSPEDRPREHRRERHLFAHEIRGLVRRLRTREHPKVEVTVVVDQPQDGAIYGTDAPAHAWEDIMSWAAALHAIPPS